MEDFNNIINWENLLEKSIDFQNNKPFKFGFVEEFFDRNFYDKLYETYPKIDDSWSIINTPSKYQYAKFWNKPNSSELEILNDDPDTSVSDEWNKLKRYLLTDEFIKNFEKFSGLKNLKCKYFCFLAYKQGGFQLPHIHNFGPSTLTIMVYLSKGWEKGDPGGTYMSTEIDESTIIFEPYNLDNTMALFQDGPNAAHGARYITKNVVRQAVQITLEGYSESSGWTGGHGVENFISELLKEDELKN